MYEVGGIKERREREMFSEKGEWKNAIFSLGSWLTKKELKASTGILRGHIESQPYSGSSILDEKRPIFPTYFEMQCKICGTKIIRKTITLYEWMVYVHTLASTTH